MAYSDPDWNLLCQTCGQRRGNHRTADKGTQCAENAEYDGDAQLAKWSDTLRFKETDPPQYRPDGWYKCHESVVSQSFKALVDEVLDQEITNQLLFAPVKAKPAKKEKKTKPWEEQKFNTPKVPKGEIKYYKPAPNKDHKPVTGDQVVTLDLGKVEETTIASMMAEKLKSYMLSVGVKDPSSLISSTSEPTKAKALTKEDILKAVELLEIANSKPPVYPEPYYNQFYGRGLRDVIREEPPIEALAEAYLKTNASTKTLVQMLVGFAQSAENPAVRKLAEEVGNKNSEVRSLELQVRSKHSAIKRVVEQRDDWHNKYLALEAKMADMVPKARPMVPRSFSENGRKFQDIA